MTSTCSAVTILATSIVLAVFIIAGVSHDEREGFSGEEECHRRSHGGHVHHHHHYYGAGECRRRSDMSRQLTPATLEESTGHHPHQHRGPKSDKAEMYGGKPWRNPQSIEDPRLEKPLDDLEAGK